MATPTYICIDDDATESNPLVAAIKRSKQVEMIPQQPIEPEEQVEAIMAADYDGILLDLRLDRKSNPEKYRATYTSNTLAQWLRDKITISGSRDIPIVLWSSKPNLTKFYDLDQTGHDLYDHVIVKTRVRDDVKAVARELRALSAGYEKIGDLHTKGRRGFFRMLGLDQKAGLLLDPRIGAQFDDNDQAKRYPAHRFARFIFKELIEQPYPLVDETLLGARLGVATTCAGWNRLLKHFEAARFGGVFGEAWTRWWWDAIAEMLMPRLGLSARVFRALPAIERVKRIAATFSVKGLVAADPIAATYSTAFWTVCDGLNRPLDPADGFVSSLSSREGWHDRRYVSLKAAVERKGIDRGLRVSALEKARFEQVMGASQRAHKA